MQYIAYPQLSSLLYELQAPTYYYQSIDQGYMYLFWLGLHTNHREIF